jgi:hypothetical protein
MAYVADVLATHLESPDWQPAMIEVPLDDGSGRCVLVLRVNPDATPRPETGGDGLRRYCAGWY